MGLRKRVFQLVVSLYFYLIYFFFFFLKDDFSSLASPYFSFIISWNSLSLRVVIICPISSSEGFTWMIRPKKTLLSHSAKARRAYSDFSKVKKKYPLFFMSYSFGSFILTILPKRPNSALISSSVKL